ncbi:MAG: ABC transporter ATP-binding protein, partial [Acidimicrobiales bacterium]
KVALVAALASDVELLLLDEPTSGLDPLMEASFRACIAEEAARGRTVLLSSHILAEVEAACEKVTIIREGRTVETGDLRALRYLTHLRVEAELAAPLPPGALDGLDGVHDLVVDGAAVSCQVGASSLDELLRRFGAVGVRNLLSRQPTLEELFLRFYDGTGPGAPAAAARADSESGGPPA